MLPLLEICCKIYILSNWEAINKGDRMLELDIDGNNLKIVEDEIGRYD